MKKLLTIILLLSAFVAVSAQEFDYDFDFRYYFHNGEYDYSNNYFESSGTINAAALTPWIGFSYRQNEDISHRAMLGVDLRKDMGTKLSLDTHELLLYYQLSIEPYKDERFDAIFGIYPRSFSEGWYNTAFFSDYNLFEDRFFEGCWFKYRTDRTFAEIGLDWHGRKDMLERERFQILSSGRFNVYKAFSLGYALKFYHFSSSRLLQNVVDNHMLHIYAELAPRMTALDRFSITAGAIGTYQWDRRFEDGRRFPFGFFSSQEIAYKGFGLRNEWYGGDDLMPLFAGNVLGFTYGTDLYHGSLFYHTQIESFSVYDTLSLYYEWKPVPAVAVKASVTAHIGNPTADFGFFRGWQQVISATFDLDSIRRR